MILEALFAAGQASALAALPAIAQANAIYYRCELQLISATDAALQLHVGAKPLSLSLLRERRNGHDQWQAWGHADLAVHRAADSAFPVGVTEKPGRTNLTWNIHEAVADGSVVWDSSDRVSGKIELSISKSHFHPAAYVVAGSCQGGPPPWGSNKPGKVQ